MARRPPNADETLPAPVLLNSRQVAALLSTSPANVRQAVSRGHLPAPARYPGLGLRWRSEVISAWIAKHAATA